MVVSLLAVASTHLGANAIGLMADPIPEPCPYGWCVIQCPDLKTQESICWNQAGCDPSKHAVAPSCGEGSCPFYPNEIDCDGQL
jgi:hypothetical protein